MIGKIRRLADLYEGLRRLPSMEDRVSRLENQRTRMQERINALQQQLNVWQRQSEQRLDRAEEQTDVLKSSFEVPQEMVEEFLEWKAANPVPARPLVSVIVATHDRARLLTERCIPSVLGQTYDNLELLVVGDCCTDETEAAVAGIDDPRLRFVNLPERGVYPEDPLRRWMVAGTPAMNRALKMVGGDYVTHLDDDDAYTPDRLEKLVAFATENGCDFVWHPYWWENSEGQWRLNEANKFVYAHITTSSVFYRSWFARIPWDINAHRLMEPGDWNRFRKIKYLNPVSMRYPEPLLKHYRQRQRT